VQLNLIGNCYGLSGEETKELWFQVDIEGNGVIDYKQFMVKHYRIHMKLPFILCSNNNYCMVAASFMESNRVRSKR
jgi:hypothetical protein